MVNSHLAQMPYDHLFVETNNALYDMDFVKERELRGGWEWKAQKDIYNSRSLDYILEQIRTLGWEIQPLSSTGLRHPIGARAKLTIQLPYWMYFRMSGDPEKCRLYEDYYIDKIDLF